MKQILTTVNFKKESYFRLINFAQKDDQFLIFKTETIPWKITPISMSTTRSAEELDLKHGIHDGIRNEKYFTIDIESLYENITEDQWYIVAEFDILLEIGNEKITKKLEHRFDSSSKSFNSGPFKIPENFPLPISEISGNFSIKPEIRIKEDVGVHLSEFSIPRNIDSEIVVRLDDHILFVDKYALMAFSSEIRNKISGNEFRTYRRMFEYADFVNFLRMLYGQKQEYTEHNVQGLAFLALMYKVEFYISECEDYIIASKELSIDYKLLLSEVCELPKVQGVIMENITMDEIKQAFAEPFHLWKRTEELITMKLGDNAETIIKELKSTERWKKFNDFWDKLEEELKKISNKAEDYISRTKSEEN